MKSKILWFIILILSTGAIIDVVRYLKPGPTNKTIIRAAETFPASSAKEIILAYNAYGGIYPGIADIIHKEFFASTYPCKLCYLSFGTFGMKDEWKQFLDSLDYKIIQLHKDQVRKIYSPQNIPLPAILINDDVTTEVLVNAKEINGVHTLQQLKTLVASKFN